jgi:predicted small lipoprotein YifL
MGLAMAMALALGVSGCGQKGPLHLPPPAAAAGGTQAASGPTR